MDARGRLDGDAAQGVGHSGRVAVYEVADNELAVGSTLSAPEIATIVKATGALQRVWAVEAGESVFGTIVLRHYDERTGVHLSARQPGRFTIHPEHQTHTFTLINGVQAEETVLALCGPLEEGRLDDPPAVYLAVTLTNESEETVRVSTYAFADLRGSTGHDVVARYHASQNALFAWNASNPDCVRAVACTVKPAGHETTQDAGMAVSGSSPGRLSNRTKADGDPLGVLHITSQLKPGRSRSFAFILTYSCHGRLSASAALRACPPVDAALGRTMEHYSEVMRCGVVLTPDLHINRGVLWAKANMLRTLMKAPTGWCFTNDPTRSNNSVGRDTAWFGFGADYVAPWFARESLMAYLERQQSSGKIVEYYDVRTGHTEDYGLNINDNTPLVVLALWHHFSVTGDKDFLRRVYPAARKAARYIVSQRNDKGLVWCTATGTAEHGIASWRNVIRDYRITGAVTEINSECHAALRTISRMARVLGEHEESAGFLREAEALKEAINAHLFNESSGLYYLCRGDDGDAHSDVTCDLVFPLLFGVAPEHIASRIVGRLSAADFWTQSGMRTVPRDAADYSPDAGAGLLGGVWVGVAFWYAFAAARFTPEFMARALSMSFRNYSTDPRRNNTVPGQFSEWLHGETLVNQGMMLSPWYPPRYVWAAIEGMAGLDVHSDTLHIDPHLAPSWQWMAVQNLPFRGRRLTFFVVRAPDVCVYASERIDRPEGARVYDEDITAVLHSDGPDISAVGLKQGPNMVVLVGSTGEQSVSTSVRIGIETSGEYHIRVFDSLLGEWVESGRWAGARLREGVTLQVERLGFNLLDIRQEV